MKDTAITTYIDIDPWGAVEIWWLYRSWMYSGSYLRSDLVLFHNPQLDMSKMPHGDGIHYHALDPVCEQDPLWHDYRRINGLWFATTPEAEHALHLYKYTLKTDGDCFLTRNFVTWYPRLATFGVNQYAARDPDVGRRISAICEKMGIMEFHKNVIGTIMAYSPKVTEYSKVSYEIAKRLKANEFKDGPGEWPHWYEYVVCMYACGIASNAMFKGGYMIGGLDCMCMSGDLMGTTDFHIHAFHSDFDFSKHKWREGGYDDIDFGALNPNVIKDYCTLMAGRRNA